ncbi:hypothetical protein [Beijerinckia indica]|uniref:hypothetical protein n=1 Tax=Beijerinckia indica TaxID=533 RepID=UPI0005A07BBF|nr:hypothetical protein [Beijerinckia indica]
MDWEDNDFRALRKGIAAREPLPWNKMRARTIRAENGGTGQEIIQDLKKRETDIQGNYPFQAK